MKRLGQVVLQILRLFGVLIAYIIIRKIEVTNQADINRKEWSLGVIEGTWIILGIWFVILIFTGIMSDCFRQRLRNGLFLLKDMFGVFIIIGLLYVWYWIVSKFWEGWYIQSELTEAEQLEPTQSFFILCFYVL